MTPTSAPERVDTKKFFEELRKGSTIVETMVDGRSVELTLTPPDAKASKHATFLISRLNYGNTSFMLEKIIKFACCSCIDGVNEDNVVTFLRKFPPMPKVVTESLDLLGVHKRIQDIMIEKAKNEEEKAKEVASKISRN